MDEEQDVKEHAKEEQMEDGEAAALEKQEKVETPAEKGNESTENLKNEEQTAESGRGELGKDVSSKQDGAEVTKEAAEDAEQDGNGTEEQGGNEQPEPMEEDAEGRAVDCGAHW